ncbi:MAG: hypothetical protein JO257_29195 [Deltaproteobacteria bacterium]|nr:hypothetical protein [Deltaproteobacteria bacterium]
MSGPKRNPDKLNTIGIVVVGICGAVLVYVTIVALQAFYMNDTSQVQTMADYGGQDKTALGHKADELRNISEVGKGTAPGTVHLKIEDAMNLVIRDAAKDPAHLVPLAPSTKPTIEPTFGRPRPLGGTPAPAAPEGTGSAAGSAASAAPAQPTGAGAGDAQPVPGAGNMPGSKTTVPAVGGGNGH